jgi:RNA polymerase-binding transcription factor DksA
MDQAHLTDLKKTLEEEKALVEKELNSVSTPDIGDHVPGPRAPKFPQYGNDAMQENTASPQEVAEYTVNADVTGTLESRLEHINAALARMADGSYGTCAKCGNPIGDDRLNADPAATLCINDAKAHV